MSMRAAAKFRHPINGQGRMTGNPEVILRPDLSGGQVVNVFLYCVGLSETEPKRLKTLLAILQSLRLGGRQRGFDVGCSIPVHQGIPN
jgi:hypothetical protein